MKVSIVIPVYNGEKYLAECIESCLNQSYKDFEIIIVDDGSTDNTGLICWKYYHQHPDIIKYIPKTNGGTASALNVGIENMKGEWFKWLSADDIFNRYALEEMMNFVESVNASFLYLYYTDYEIIDSNGLHSGFFTELDRTEMSKDIQAVELYHNFFGNGSTTLIHKESLNVVGKFKEGMPYNDDYEYWLEFDENNDLIYYKNTLDNEFWYKYDKNNKQINITEQEYKELKFRKKEKEYNSRTFCSRFELMEI